MKKTKVYTAPDGKEFTKRSEYRKYVFATFYTIENKTNELIVKNPGEIAGNPFKVKGCTDCTVLLLDCCEQTELSNLTRCRIFVAAGKASIKCDTCKDCIFTVGCKQLRLRYVYDCVFNLYALTPPVIEYSHHLVFKPFNGAFAGLGALLTKARLDPAIDTWSQVHDFSEEDGSVPQPHFTINGACGGGERFCGPRARRSLPPRTLAHAHARALTLPCPHPSHYSFFTFK